MLGAFKRGANGRHRFGRFRNLKLVVFPAESKGFSKRFSIAFPDGFQPFSGSSSGFSGVGQSGGERPRNAGEVVLRLAVEHQTCRFH